MWAKVRKDVSLAEAHQKHGLGSSLNMRISPELTCSRHEEPHGWSAVCRQGVVVCGKAR
jgi:hypothetical protein